MESDGWRTSSGHVPGKLGRAAFWFSFSLRQAGEPAGSRPSCRGPLLTVGGSSTHPECCDHRPEKASRPRLSVDILLDPGGSSRFASLVGESPPFCFPLKIGLVLSSKHAVCL